MERCASCGRPRTGARFCTGCGAPFGNTALPNATSGGRAPASRSHDRPAHEPSQVGRRLQMLVGLSALAAAGLAVTLMILHSPAQITPMPAPTHTFRPPAKQPPATPSVLAQQQAAHSLAALLAQSAEDRASVIRAVKDVSHCGQHLHQDAALNQDKATLLNTARSRRQLRSQLAVMPMWSALPGPMLRLLSTAWQASIQADDDYAKWAKDQVSSSCASGWSDPYAQAATVPDNKANAYKEAFTQMWNPLARRYRLTVYKPGEL